MLNSSNISLQKTNLNLTVFERESNFQYHIDIERHQHHYHDVLYHIDGYDKLSTSDFIYFSNRSIIETLYLRVNLKT